MIEALVVAAVFTCALVTVGTLMETAPFAPLVERASAWLFGPMTDEERADERAVAARQDEIDALERIYDRG